MQVQPLTEGAYFHIYNRGVNGEDLFKEKKNYYFFLEKYKLYCSDVFETFCYALLKNHFHLVVKVKENVLVPKYEGEGMIQLNASKLLGHLFNSYAQSINKSYKRTGSLFESPFERKEIRHNHHLTALIMYCHFNPQQHGFVTDFRNYEFTSYHSIIANDNHIIATEKVIEWFGSKNLFEKAHTITIEEKTFVNYYLNNYHQTANEVYNRRRGYIPRQRLSDLTAVE